jgi:hypothetical protein
LEWPTRDVQAQVKKAAFIKVKVADPWMIMPAIVVDVTPKPVVKFVVAGVAVVIVEADPRYPVASTPPASPIWIMMLLVPLVETPEKWTQIRLTPAGIEVKLIAVPDVEF